MGGSYILYLPITSKYANYSMIFKLMYLIPKSVEACLIPEQKRGKVRLGELFFKGTFLGPLGISLPDLLGELKLHSSGGVLDSNH